MRRLVVAALFLLACANGPDGANPDPKCHPLAVGDCVLPWPSSFYQKADSSTATGLRVALPDGVLPANPNGVAMDPSRLNALDGFSPATMLVVNPKTRLDATRLPPASDLAQSLAASSTVQLVRYDTGERVPLFAEPDANAAFDEDQVLLIHPQVRLAPGTRYVVALRALVDANGRRVRNAPFEALKAGTASTARLQALAPLYRDLFAKLAAWGVPKSELTLAWDFTTGSDAQLLRLPAMRDQALAAWAQERLGYHVTSTDTPTDPHLYRELLGTFDAPTFLASDDPTATLGFGADGQPQLRGVQSFPLVVHVPQCVQTATHPLPILIFGHGLFGNAQGEMNSSYQKSVIDQLCMVEVGTDWIGLSDADVAGVAAKVIPDFSQLAFVTDRLQQAQVNFQVLTQLALAQLKNDPNLMWNGKPIVDGSEVYYYGISQGGIGGGTFMALSPFVLRGALNVAGGEYSLMLTRSVDFKSLKTFLNITYPSQRDQELLLALSQSYFDWSDPITFAPYSLKAPLDGPDGKPLAPRHLLLQEAIGDAQVPNLATRVVVRTLGLSLLDPPVETVYGVGETSAPADAAYTQWDIHPSPLPGPANTPAAEDNGAHQTIRALPALIAQLAAFFRPDGQVTQTCGGPCVFPQ